MLLKMQILKFKAQEYAAGEAKIAVIIKKVN